MDSPRLLNQFEIGKVIGKGSFSVVHIAVHKATQEKVAIKIINKKEAIMKKEGEIEKTRIETEVKILKAVNHKNIVPLIDIVDTGGYLYLIMEYITGGQLFDRVLQKGKYSERDCGKAVRKLVQAIEYLHSLKIAHRDLKPENLLLPIEDDTNVMISDFGLSRIIHEDSLMSSAVGTPYYVAPEVITASGYTYSVDLWSIGVITYFMLAGFPPFLGSTMEEIFEAIGKAEYDFPAQYFDVVSENAKDFIRKLLVVNPSMRSTVPQCLQHPFLNV